MLLAELGGMTNRGRWENIIVASRETSEHILAQKSLCSIYVCILSRKDALQPPQGKNWPPHMGKRPCSPFTPWLKTGQVKKWPKPNSSKKLCGRGDSRPAGECNKVLFREKDQVLHKQAQVEWARCFTLGTQTFVKRPSSRLCIMC